MNLRMQRKMAAHLLKCGGTRVRIQASKDVEEALTRQDVRELIAKGVIVKLQKRGACRVHARKIKAQKKKRRRGGPGKTRGGWGAKNPGKANWVKKIRALRKTLRMLRDTGQMEVYDFRKTLLMAKGGAFRNRKHMMFFLKDKDLLSKPGEALGKKTAKKKAKPKAGKKAEAARKAVKK